MAEPDRIRWHCRRGMLELDLILQRFMRQHFEGLDPEERRAFEELLDLPDNDLLDVVMGRTAPAAQRFQSVVALLRAV